MLVPQLKLDLEGLRVDSFDTGVRPDAGGPGGVLESEYHHTVLRNTEWVSCGGTCRTCGGTDCYA